MKTPADTSPEAERVLLEVYRAMPLHGRWRLLGETWGTARALHAAGVRLRRPTATDREIGQDWLVRTYGFTHPITSAGSLMEPYEQNLRTLQEVTHALTALEIPYALGGSMASSLYGISRSTRNADLSVEPFPGKEAQLAVSFGPEYDVSLAAVEEAMRNRSTFNLINTSSGFKVDLFVRKEDPFERLALERRRPIDVPGLVDQAVFVQAPEDLTLYKLRWFRQGGEISEQQWQDVLGVLRVQAGQLDEAYLDRWAGHLQLADLLARARHEAAS